MYKLIIRPVLFLFPPEWVHELASAWIRILDKMPGINQLIRHIYRVKHPALERKFFGLTFENPVGLAAGFDKDADMLDGLSNFGFGFIEVGTVTPEPQPGNPKPRLFRIPVDKALINRMGFNNQGVERMVNRLKRRRSRVIVGGNIGKNKTSPNENALQDYLRCLNALYDHVDYFVVNVSSPNTPGLRQLQEKGPLTDLLTRLQHEIQKRPRKKPLLLKIAPDLSFEQLDDIISILNTLKLDGIVATNTTTDRDQLSVTSQQIDKIGAGGLSGKPLEAIANEIIRYLRQNLNEDIAIIGVGGIMTEEDVFRKLDAGASLVQLYTGFIYEGPGIVKKLNQALISRFTEGRKG
ncbi:MAG: quinone-dependent dihydroorotate dehydrogenase [Cyclobacteriaceae bacterium]|nr:quinone-dependent dihydroorotate dehydrogenase [Cyclobacteriaceae bacterium]